MKSRDQSDERGVQFSVREMRAGTHARTRTVGVMRGTRAFRVLEVAFNHEGFGILEVGFVEVGGPSIHVEGCTGGDDSIFVFDVFDAGSGQADGDNGEESEDFSDECCDVGNFLFNQTSLPGVSFGIDFHDFFVSSLLDFLAVGRRQVGDAHDEVARNCVETSRNHS